MSFTRLTKLIQSSSQQSETLASKPKKIKTRLVGGILLKLYQYKCIKFGLSRPAAGFFLAPGLGKTLISLMLFKLLKDLDLVDELVVVAKRRIIYNVWKQEIKKWKFDFHAVIVHGKLKQYNLTTPADVRLINYEGLEWLAKKGRDGKVQQEFFARKKRLMLVMDESSKLRHTTTVRFRSLKKLLPYFTRRYILTGSPVPNGLMNLFGQIYALDLGEKLGRYITEYRNQYFYPAGYMGYEWRLQPGAEERIYERIRPLVIRYGTDQLNMPPLTFIDRYIALPKAVRVKYDELEREYLIRYKEGDIVAANAAVVSGKLRQIANGAAYYSASPDVLVDELDEKVLKKKGPQKWRPMHDEKCSELVELLEELQGEPALVTFEFQHDKLHLQDYFRRNAPQFKDAPFVDGRSKDRDVTRLLKKWDKGLLPVLFGQPDSVAHGLNLQGRGGIVIFFAMTWNLENYEQFIQRVWRQGQERRVLVYRILAKNTVDMDMVTAINVKDHDQTSLLEAMSRRTGIQRRRAA